MKINMQFSAVVALALAFGFTGCVNPQGQPVGGVSFRDQSRTAGALTGAGAGFGVARALKLNDRDTLLLTGLTAFIGHSIGSAIGGSMDRKYEANRARDARTARRLERADAAIVSARRENATLRRSLVALRHSNNTASKQKAAEARQAAQRSLDRLEQEIVAVDVDRQRARNQRLTAEHQALSQRRAALANQNSILSSTLSQLRAEENRLSRQ